MPKPSNRPKTWFDTEHSCLLAAQDLGTGLGIVSGNANTDQ